MVESKRLKISAILGSLFAVFSAWYPASVYADAGFPYGYGPYPVTYVLLCLFFGAFGTMESYVLMSDF
jgi:hypothetical protein